MPIEPTTEPGVDPPPTKTNVLAQIRENDYQLLHGDDPPRYYETALELLQSANNSIDELLFDGISFYDHEIVDISEQIVEFCANSLTVMRLLDAGTFLVSGTEVIFPNVVRVYLEYESLPDIQEIHRVYPAMTELTIDTSHFRANLVQVAQLLPLTPQLRKLDVSVAANSIIQAMQANLPHLDGLAISYDVTLPISRPVHFDSVRTLGLRIVKLTEGTVKAIPLTFDGLEAVVLKAASIDVQLTEWIVQNGDLKSVTLEQPVDAESMRRLVAALDRLPKLRRVSLTIDYKADLASILSHHLDGVDNVTLTIDGIFREAQQSLLDTLPKRWTVVDGWRNSGWQQTLVVAPVRRNCLTILTFFRGK